MLENNPRKRSRAFTLIEILICLLLISVALAGGGIKYLKVMKKEQASFQQDLFLSKVHLAEEIMLDYKVNVTLKLETEGEKVKCFLITPPLPEQMIKRCAADLWLDDVRQIEWNGQECHELRLEFESPLGVTPRGMLVLKNQDQAFSFFFLGYPGKILKNNEAYQCDEEKAPYPKEIVFTN